MRPADQYEPARFARARHALINLVVALAGVRDVEVFLGLTVLGNLNTSVGR